jgi:hypothetical protein
MKKMMYLFGLTIALFSCTTNNGDNFVGEWKKVGNERETLNISKLSDKDFKVTYEEKPKEGSNFMDNMMRDVRENNYSLEDGKLVAGMGSTIVYANGKLSYNGNEYEK